ncbi:hypothetical protein ABW19_dt0202801 [Dactylella cylindrospora]|nr:hypothetical protein ABW19_dt0202801 [Dactylella cylindrospora]
MQKAQEQKFMRSARAVTERADVLRMILSLKIGKNFPVFLAFLVYPSHSHFFLFPQVLVRCLNKTRGREKKLEQGSLGELWVVLVRLWVQVREQKIEPEKGTEKRNQPESGPPLKRGFRLRVNC